MLIVSALLGGEPAHEFHYRNCIRLIRGRLGQAQKRAHNGGPFCSPYSTTKGAASGALIALCYFGDTFQNRILPSRLPLASSVHFGAKARACIASPPSVSE